MNSRNVRLAVALPVVVSAIVTVISAGGCGGSGYVPSPNAPVATAAVSDAQVTGQYNIVLTSQSQATTTIYTRFSGSGKALTGATTLVCPSNELAQCKDGDPAHVSVTARGTVSGANVALTISFLSSTGGHAVTMHGTATTASPPVLIGTYNDSLGDSGSWMASPANFAIGPASGQSLYSGTLNSTANPLTITPRIFMTLRGDVSSKLTGTATLTNFPCGTALTLSGDAVGDAFVVSDALTKVRLLVLPSGTTAAEAVYALAYQFDASAPSCGGDVGRGSISLQNIWNY
jgi:hypothetical protein